MSILLLSVIAVAVLWILGGKQTEFSTALSIDAPPEVIFPYLTQPEQLKSWTTGLSEVEELLPAPKVGLGSGGPVQTTMRVISMPDGSQARFDDRVIRFEENQFISVQSTGSQKVLIYIYQLEPRDGQTFLSYRLKSTNCGTGRFLAPLSSNNDYQDRIDGDIRKLKALVESSPRPTPKEVVEPVPLEEPKFQPPVDSNDIPDVSNAQRDAETPVSGQPFSF